MSTRVQRHGAQINGGTTRFNLWAPNAETVAIDIRGEKEPVPMQAQGDGWFSAHYSCGAGTEYCFVIDNEHRVPDPASHCQVDDVHGYSRIVDHNQYQWKSNDWCGLPWHQTIIYEVHVGVLGGYKGVEKRLPALAALGVTAIELMPLHQFPGTRNWGYDGVLHSAPANAYGTIDELKSLIDTAHQLGLMVFVDVVYNHFGPDGNYLHSYASPFFRDDIKTGWGSAIDFRRTEVRDFFIENALMWVLDYRIDGLRFDAVHAISEKNFLVEMATRLRSSIPSERHLHLVLENEENSAFLLEQGFDAQWNDDGHNVLHHLLTNEDEGYYADFCKDATQKLARCLKDGFIYQGDSTRHGKPRGEPSAHLPPTAFVLFLQNHDQVGNRAFGERLPLLANRDALKAATGLLLLSPMIPLLFMGEEWASEQPFFYFTDHHDELAVAVREGRRNEFADFAHFVDSEIRERIPDPNDEKTFSACVLDYDSCNQPLQREWRDLYRNLLELRHVEIIPRLQGAHAEEVQILGDAAVSARWRMGDGSLLRIDLNLSSSAVATPDPRNYEKLIFRHRVDHQSERDGFLPPYSIIVTL
jgi:maltooligosyltrehalose trehalohydrolase